MNSVLVTTSRSHPVRTDIVRETLPPDWRVETYEVDGDGIEYGSPAELAAAATGHDALLLRPGCVTQTVFETATSLQIVAVHGSGYDRVDVDAATANDVIVTHAPNAPAPAVVEQTVATMIVLLRDLLNIHELTTAGGWDTAQNHGRELGRTTVGLVGVGTIGLDVGRKVRGFGADVIAYDPFVAGDRDDSDIYPRTTAETVTDAGIELVDFDSLLERADVLSLHAPLTDDTRNLIGRDELAAMADGYLINAARGGLVDEDALVEAVENETLAGAALDVMKEEPPASDNPLLTAPNVLVTPHTAGVTGGYLERGARFCAEKIESTLSGERPTTPVNPAVFD